MQSGQPYLFSIWHNRLILVPVVLPGKFSRNLGFLASRSRDGGYITDLLEEFGLRGVRGSSSKGGAMALREMTKLLRQGYAIGLTPDGPRGPRYQVQHGLLYLAAKTRVPIVPVAINSPHHFELKNWDRTQIPWPFTRVELILGEPITLPIFRREDDLSPAARQIEEAMKTVCAYDHPRESELSISLAENEPETHAEAESCTKT